MHKKRHRQAEPKKKKRVRIMCLKNPVHRQLPFLFLDKPLNCAPAQLATGILANSATIAEAWKRLQSIGQQT
jgi:hypothetical protein